MVLLQQRYHDQCEWYQYTTLKEHFFYSVLPEGQGAPWKRKYPDNVIFIMKKDIPWGKIDIGIATDLDFFKMLLDHNIPAVFHIDQMPPNETEKNKHIIELNGHITLYWSSEEATQWGAGISIIRPHPIDTNRFKGYRGILKEAITVATRPIGQWPREMKGYDILKKAYPQIPIQVIAGKDSEFPNSKQIMTEEEMIWHMANYSLYFNCGFKLDRTPLEAMAVGMPVFAIRHRFNAYKDMFNENTMNIAYFDTADKMIEGAQLYLRPDNFYMLRALGEAAQKTIKEHFNPVISISQWNKAFNLAIKNHK